MRVRTPCTNLNASTRKVDEKGARGIKNVANALPPVLSCPAQITPAHPGGHSTPTSLASDLSGHVYRTRDEREWRLVTRQKRRQTIARSIPAAYHIHALLAFHECGKVTAWRGAVGSGLARRV